MAKNQFAFFFGDHPEPGSFGGGGLRAPISCKSNTILDQIQCIIILWKYTHFGFSQIFMNIYTAFNDDIITWGIDCDASCIFTF